MKLRGAINFGCSRFVRREQVFRQDAAFGTPAAADCFVCVSGRFSQSLVRADTDSIKGLYISNGFRDVQVTTSVDDNYHGKKGNLFVAFHIVEGPQTLVSSLEVEGNHALNTETAARGVRFDAGPAVFGSRRGERPQ